MEVILNQENKNDLNNQQPIFIQNEGNQQNNDISVTWTVNNDECKHQANILHNNNQSYSPVLSLANKMNNLDINPSSNNLNFGYFSKEIKEGNNLFKKKPQDNSDMVSIHSQKNGNTPHNFNTQHNQHQSFNFDPKEPFDFNKLSQQPNQNNLINNNSGNIMNFQNAPQNYNNNNNNTFFNNNNGSRRQNPNQGQNNYNNKSKERSKSPMRNFYGEDKNKSYGFKIATETISKKISGVFTKIAVPFYANLLSDQNSNEHDLLDGFFNKKFIFGLPTSDELTNHCKTIGIINPNPNFINKILADAKTSITRNQYIKNLVNKL